MYNEPAVPENTNNHERILVVDDEDYIRQMVCSMLAPAGYRCTAAESGHAAMDLLASGAEFELILSDLMMAGMDGLALLHSTKERYPDMHIIMVTAVGEISVAMGAIRAGAYDYLLKPFEREQLLNSVRRALEHRRLRLVERTFQLELQSKVEAQTAKLRQMYADLKRANEELKKSYDITLEALGDALDLRDAETEGHSKRVTAFTIAIARRLQLPNEEIEVIARGAFLHDMGKMAIPDGILRKPGPLNAEEVRIMREHCRSGYQMVSKIPFLAEAAEIIYAHQERWDGTGYPRGLKGEQIPLGARIFAIADTLDAITSDRPYRAAQSYQAAREEIVRWSGRQFDPTIVGVFLSIPESEWAFVRQHIRSQVFRVPPMPQLPSSAREHWEKVPSAD